MSKSVSGRRGRGWCACDTIQSHSLSLSPLLLASPSPENGTYWDGVGDDDYGGDDDDDDGGEG